MNRPLVITDCDEVLMHMVVHFRDWLDAAHHIHFDVDSRFEEALRHKDSHDPVERHLVWTLLGRFFLDAIDLQQPIAGAQQAMALLAQRADVVVLTNLRDEALPNRRSQLDTHGFPFPVFGNQGGKGPAVVRLLEQYRPSVALFIDDLENNHESVAEHAPQVWRLHMVGEPLIAVRAPTSPDAHARIDDWEQALPWLLDRIDAGLPASVSEAQTSAS